MDFGIALGEASFNHQGFVNGDACTRSRLRGNRLEIVSRASLEIPPRDISRGYNIFKG